MTGLRKRSRRAHRLALLFVAMFGALGVVVAGAGAEGGGEVGFAAQSLGIHDARAAFPSLIARPDGSIVALAGRERQQIETYLADGEPDPGAAPVEAGGSRLFPAAGGKTFVAGYQKLIRLDANGNPDASFGGTGTVKTAREVQEVYELGSGRIALIGIESGGTHTIFRDVTVELRNQDGSAVGGEASRSVPVTFENATPEVVANGAGGALVVGDAFLLEVNADGSIENGFGKEGVVAVPHGTVGAHVFPDGSIETVGSEPAEESGPEGSLVLRRYSATGEPDAGFGTKGARSFDLGGAFEAKVASWGGDGSVVVGGHLSTRGRCGESACEEVPALAAFDASGELEKGFGGTGLLELRPLAGPPGELSSNGITALVRRPDGSFVAAGDAPPLQTTGFLAAFSPQGSLLTGFGEGGIAKALDERPASQELAGFVTQPGVGILGVGTSDVGIEEHPVMVRYLSDGSLDPAFGAGTGYVTLYQPQSYPHGASGFATEGDEVLTSTYDSQGLLLMAHAEDGSPVASFGSDGSVALPVGDLPDELALAPSGDPLVLGTHVADPENTAALLRYRPDGGLDRSFAQGGVLTLRPPGRHRKAMKGKTLMVQPGGKILVGGRQENRFDLLRLLPDGRPDPSFGSGGWSIVKFSQRARALALAQIGSHIYAVGTTGDEGKGQEIALMRFGRDGKLDRGFGTDGRVIGRLPTVAHPTQVLSTSHGPLIVSSRGRRPLLRLVRAGGKLALRPVGPTLPFISGAHAVVEGSNLLLGWGTYDPATESVHYRFDRLPLG